MRPFIIAAFAAAVFASPASALAQLPPESDVIAESLTLRTTAVVEFNVQSWRGDIADDGEGLSVTIGVNGIDGKAAFLWCNKPTLQQCTSGSAFWEPIGRINGGTGRAYALPNTGAQLAGETTRVWTTLYGEPDPSDGRRPLIAREARDVTFVSQAPTPEPTLAPATPTPEPTPPWRVTSDLVQ